RIRREGPPRDQEARPERVSEEACSIPVRSAIVHATSSRRLQTLSPESKNTRKTALGGRFRRVPGTTPFRYILPNHPILNPWTPALRNLRENFRSFFL